MIAQINKYLWVSDVVDAADNQVDFDYVVSISDPGLKFYGNIIFNIPDDDNADEYLFKTAVKTVNMLMKSNMKTLVHCLGNNPLILDGLRFRNISDVKNTMSSKGEIDIINRFFKRTYKGDIIKMKIKTLLDYYYFTPEHEILVWRKTNYKHGYLYLKTKPEWVTAANIKKTDFVVIPKIKYKWIKTDYSLDMLYFFGIYVAEGYSSHSKYPSGNRVEIGMYNKSIIDKLSSLFINSKIYKEKREKNILYRLRINDIALRDFLEDNFGRYARNKKIPDFIMKSTFDEKKAFLNGLLDGDGNKRVNRSILTTSSKNMVYDAYLLLLTMNKLSYLTYREEDKEYIGYKWRSKVYILEIPEKPRYYKELDNYFIVPIKEIIKEEYDGVVHNLETGNNDYTIPFIVHNCAAGMSRSPAVCIGALMMYSNLKYEEAYDVVKAARGSVFIHPKFISILQHPRNWG